MTAAIVFGLLYLGIAGVFAGCFGIERSDIRTKMNSLKNNPHQGVKRFDKPTEDYKNKAARYLRVVNYQRFSLVWPGLVVFLAVRGIVRINQAKRQSVKEMTRIVQEGSW